ncbi:two component regulator with propeller domain [Winogradskyella wandonensis]|uniref:Two component regulator with propeller domain n=1 Tax=Winogradskyella wandonensis TaxID=1442586 RepID=A0A4R1KVS9_9FLAO|nr:LytTR family transcriptional regulator DNA-binding domain-containing protein [Winogradskyella wandonensis]TCK69302.1 two component regulator with propeller domain [Winogradskyella wandonensis]
MKSTLHLIAFVFTLFVGNSQSYIYDHFDVDDGLPSSEVFDVYQDKLGYIWFATDRGLSRYNGYEFKNFTSEDGLPGNTILDFFPQEDGRIFCFELHSKTLFYFNEVFDGFKLYQFNDELKQSLTSRTIIKSIHVDSKGNLTIGGYSIFGFIEITNKGEVINHYNKYYRADLSYSERKSHIMVGVYKKSKLFGSLYYKYDSDNQILAIPTENPNSSRLSVEFLNDTLIAFINIKLVTFSTSKGVSYYETAQNPIGIKRINDTIFWVGYYSQGAEFRDIYGNVLGTFLPNKSVSNFLIDAQGSYWFTTLDDGIFRVKNSDIKVFTNENVNSLVKDDKNQLYAGYYNGDVAKIKNLKIKLLYKGKNDRPAQVEFNSEASEVYASSDFVIRNLAQKQSAISIEGGRKLPENVLSPLVTTASTTYRIVQNDTIALYDVGIRTEDVCIYNGNILIASPSGLYAKKDNKTEPYQPSPLLKSRLYDIDINSTKNTVYIASQDHGLIVFGDSIYNINKTNGLTHNSINEVHVENDSTIWACTNTGLNRIKFKSDNSYTVDTITKTDGLLSNDINDVEIINDTVWVATKRGLCFFEKDLIDRKDTLNVLSLSLKEVRVNKAIIKESNIKLSHNQNSIDFEVEAISLKNTDKIEYLYRLKEIDSSWSRTSNRIISFPSLSPGAYTFEAKAQVNDIENELLSSYSFRILPPFWKSWWFYSLTAIIFCGLIYLFFKFRVLSYNKDIIRELMRLAVKRLKRKEQFYKFRANGEDFKIPTHEILFVHSQGNYLDIVTLKKTYTIRCKIGDFISSTPDSLEYLRVHRSYIIRIDQVSSKGRNWVVIKDNKIPVGETYLKELENIKF